MNLLGSIDFPPPSSSSFSSYKKLRLRDTIDFPLAASAVSLRFDNGSCKEAKVVISAVDSRPKSVPEAEDILKGEEITEKIALKAGEAAAKAAKPIKNTVSTPSYRRKMVAVMTKRAILEASQECKASNPEK